MAAQTEEELLKELKDINKRLKEVRNNKLMRHMKEDVGKVYEIESILNEMNCKLSNSDPLYSDLYMFKCQTTQLLTCIYDRHSDRIIEIFKKEDVEAKEEVVVKEEECPICCDNVAHIMLECCNKDLCINCFSSLYEKGFLRCPFCRANLSS